MTFYSVKILKCESFLSLYKLILKMGPFYSVNFLKVSLIYLNLAEFGAPECTYKHMICFSNYNR